jgi:hypothetical protein
MLWSLWHKACQINGYWYLLHSTVSWVTVLAKSIRHLGIHEKIF